MARFLGINCFFTGTEISKHPDLQNLLSITITFLSAVTPDPILF